MDCCGRVCRACFATLRRGVTSGVTSVTGPLSEVVTGGLHRSGGASYWDSPRIARRRRTTSIAVDGELEDAGPAEFGTLAAGWLCALVPDPLEPVAGGCGVTGRVGEWDPSAAALVGADPVCRKRVGRGAVALDFALGGTATAGFPAIVRRLAGAGDAVTEFCFCTEFCC